VRLWERRRVALTPAQIDAGSPEPPSGAAAAYEWVPEPTAPVISAAPASRKAKDALALALALALAADAIDGTGGLGTRACAVKSLLVSAQMVTAGLSDGRMAVWGHRQGLTIVHFYPTSISAVYLVIITEANSSTLIPQLQLKSSHQMNDCCKSPWHPGV
jgi:hypothetical protein